VAEAEEEEDAEEAAVAEVAEEIVEEAEAHRGGQAAPGPGDAGIGEGAQ
jgi:hypothetical protein